MGCSQADPPDRRDAADASASEMNVRKHAERQRLAAALRANLGRRKAQSRDRKAAGDEGASAAAVGASGKDSVDRN
ncbi:MAG: hypothetical protein WDN46_03335 [Methylocella sp.]